MPNMDLNTFYQQALAWKHQAEEAERIEAEHRRKELKETWANLFNMAHEALPISPSWVMETRTNQQEDFPRRGVLIDLDVAFDEATKEAAKHGDGRLLPGIVRVRFRFEDELTNDWIVHKYLVIDQTNSLMEFDNPYEAFIAAYEAIKV